jgi:hypothetical protein
VPAKRKPFTGGRPSLQSFFGAALLLAAADATMSSKEVALFWARAAAAADAPVSDE